LIDAFKTCTIVKQTVYLKVLFSISCGDGLGYADIKLLERIEKEKMQEFRILRYRDDYRIFVNNPKTGEKILKLLTEVMIDLGLKLNPGKTTCDDCVILSSIKEDKLEWLRTRRDHDNLQKQLLILHSFAQRFPTQGL
jgi:hypothetical protein